MGTYFAKIWFALNLLFVYSICSVLTFINRIFIAKKNASANSHFSVLYLGLFPEQNAGFNYRVAVWSKRLRKQGVKVEAVTLIKHAEFEDLTSGKINVLVRHLYKRFFQCFKAYRFDLVVVRRTLLPFNDYGNLFLEKFILSIHANAILDIDDDMTINKTDLPAIPLYGKLLLENRQKFKESLKLYSYFIVGSNYLKELVSSVNTELDPNNICVIPTCVDYDERPERMYNQQGTKFRIGWVGSNSNQSYLDDLMPVLNAAKAKFDFELVVISGKPYHNENANYEIENLPWSLEDEFDFIKSIDIGIMPLNDGFMEKGKCGFKLIQYMGAGVISIASAVGANNEILQHGKNGYLVNTDQEWLESFETIVHSDQATMSKLSSKARSTIENKYSFNANSDKYFQFLKEVLHK